MQSPTAGKATMKERFLHSLDPPKQRARNNLVRYSFKWPTISVTYQPENSFHLHGVICFIALDTHTHTHIYTYIYISAF
jgi:hypothetical protein